MEARTTLAAKTGTVIAALGGGHAGKLHGSVPALAAWIKANATEDLEVSYLLLAVLYERIPFPEEVVAFLRAWRSQGLSVLLESHVARSRRLTAFRRHRSVRVHSGVVVDVTDTARSRFTTGIQRVARETVSRWSRERELTLVAWNSTHDALLTTTTEETERVVLRRVEGGPSAREIVVPFRATFVLPEIATEPSRVDRVRTIAAYSGSRSVAVAFDCIPITTAETAGAGMPGAFSRYLSTISRFDTVVPISGAAEVEYRGWRRMLSGAGLHGPDIHTISLPYAAGHVDDASVEEVRHELGLRDTAIVLSVGSREPRKNHIGLLHACELAWREGHNFALVLVGGNSWNTAAFDRALTQLRRKGRRILTLTGIDDSVIWALYRMARLSVFCSFNEGFGLPVAESLASGTPVITSDFGSMRELGEGRGAVLVDPRDVDAMSGAIQRLLGDHEELARLQGLTRLLPPTSWDRYAQEVWAVVDPARRPVSRSI